MHIAARLILTLRPRAGLTYRYAGQVPLLFRAIDPWGPEHTRAQNASS